ASKNENPDHVQEVPVQSNNKYFLTGNLCNPPPKNLESQQNQRAGTKCSVQSMCSGKDEEGRPVCTCLQCHTFMRRVFNKLINFKSKKGESQDKSNNQPCD